MPPPKPMTAESDITAEKSESRYSIHSDGALTIKQDATEILLNPRKATELFTFMSKMWEAA